MDFGQGSGVSPDSNKAYPSLGLSLWDYQEQPTRLVPPRSSPPVPISFALRDKAFSGFAQGAEMFFCKYKGNHHRAYFRWMVMPVEIRNRF
jgi:hypothetical protein